MTKIQKSLDVDVEDVEDDEEEEEDEEEQEEEEENEQDEEDEMDEDDEEEVEEEVEEIQDDLPPIMGDDMELIDLIIDQSQSKQRFYTDITVDAQNMYNTYPYLTKYEMARIIGVRAEQLGRNAPTLIKPPVGVSDYEIARLELLQGRCPWMIARPLPNGTRLLININLLKLL